MVGEQKTEKMMMHVALLRAEKEESESGFAQSLQEQKLISSANTQVPAGTIETGRCLERSAREMSVCCVVVVGNVPPSSGTELKKFEKEPWQEFELHVLGAW